MTSALPELLNHVTGSPIISELELDGTKVMWWGDRIQKWRRGEKFAPVTMDVAWTRQCNAACSFCIFPDVPISMADGTSKPMKDVQVGDKIISRGPGGNRASDVVAHWQTSGAKAGIKIETSHGGVLVCTRDHLVRMDNAWVEAGSLAVGDKVKAAAGVADVVSISDVPESPVYDLECYPHHNFVAGGIVVHNCYAQMQANDEGQITKEQAFQFLEDAAEVGVKGVSLISDGESTVVPWYEESVEHGSRCGLKIGVGTNGVRLKRRVLERILPHLSYLRFNFSAGEMRRYKEIMGLKERDYYQVIQNVKDAMEIVRRDNLPVTVNMQMVTMPDMHDQIMPLAHLAKELRPHYLIYKHCADNVDGHLGIDYRKYDALFDTFKEAEAMSDEGFRVVVKWSRLADEGKRDYQRCFGPPFILQMSGSGLIAPCGFLFNSRYQKFHIGNITRQRFRDIYESDRYWEVMQYLGSDQFNAQKACGPNCLQTNTNSWLDKLMKGTVQLPPPDAKAPAHLEFL